jgi:hypothetical protein
MTNFLNKIGVGIYKGSILSDDMLIIETPVDIFIENYKIATTTSGDFSIQLPNPLTQVRFVAFGYEDKVTTGAEINSLGTVFMTEAISLSSTKKTNNTLLYIVLSVLSLGGLYAYSNSKSVKTIKL